MQEALREAAAEFLAREAGRQSLLTVTRVELSENGRSAHIMFTAYPEEAEEAALGFLTRNTREFVEFFEKRVRGARTPQLTFMVDRGDKNRRRLDELSQD